MTSPSYLAEYESRLAALRAACLLRHNDKNTFNVIAYETGEVFEGFVERGLEKISKLEGDSDFTMIVFIRLLYLNEQKFPEHIQCNIRSAKERICQALAKFPFWPASDEPQSRDINQLVFWSENHLFMTLGSAYLFYQYYYTSLQSYPPNYSVFVEDTFHRYLAVHQHKLFNGVYEVNSHVYLPYTMSALLNLVDFASEREIQGMAEHTVDGIVQHLMLCADPLQGVANLSASARAFSRTRQRNFGHNINQLMNLMAGLSADPLDASQLTDYLLTTSWRPKEDAFQALHYNGFVGMMPISHDLEDMNEIFGYDVFACEGSGKSKKGKGQVDELVPLMWSAGLIVHPAFVSKTRSYQRRKHLTKNTHLWPLASSWLSDDFFDSTMLKYTHFSCGQLYTNMHLNVYKEPAEGLVLTSFEMYNVHNAGFQQLPWIANVCGIPVWTQSGTGGEGVLKFGMHNTHNPAVQQRRGLLVASYLAPNILARTIIVKNMFPYSVRAFWPKGFFEGDQMAMHRLFGNEKGRQHSAEYYGCSFSFFPHVREDGLHGMVWTAGKVKGCYIGMLCTAQSKWDRSDSDDATIQPFKAGLKLCIPRRVCDAKQHSWVVIVATVREYPNLQAFIQERLLKVVISEETGSLYEIIVEDGDQRIEYALDNRDAGKAADK